MNSISEISPVSNLDWKIADNAIISATKEHISDDIGRETKAVQDAGSDSDDEGVYAEAQK